MYNLLEYSENYSKTSVSLWNYYRDELIDDENDNNDPNNNATNSKSFEYKTSITGNTYSVAANAEEYDANKEGTKEVEIAVSLKYLANFWNSLNIPLVNSKVSLALSWSANCVITSLEKRLVTAAQRDNPAVYDISPTGTTLKIKDTKFYVLVVTLSAENDSKLFEQLKKGFKRTVKWNKYRSEMSNQTVNNNLNYLIDPTLTEVNRLFVLSFKYEEDRTCFSNYYVPKVEVKDFNVLIDGKPFFEVPVKNKEVYDMKKLLK